MTARSHIPFAMCLWWIFSLVMGYPITGHSSVIAGIGGLMPDLDHPKSALGRRIPLVSDTISALFGHRGITHSLLAVGVMILVLMSITTKPEYQELNWMVAPLCIGYISHIIGDSLTPSGVPLLYPKKKNYSLKVFKTGSLLEFIIMGLLTIFLVTIGGVGQQVYQQILMTFQQNLAF
ncbi:putative membrane-bound metal-dependent hydrolase [Xenococcus sp. PCC 7305]|uniref:metal-dependent hydrolase n=1 Tax=Xenococcus sp. PCC 7305 TaxID=102125 RepID=UPI0002AC357F|nr:metal-dependent hydrolase [Xenococcus sp. PCC 7305]ELS02723.1 putative membrane-bound metal-dependent hydrolase [Xenococcus sp. PCC 7305]